MRTYLGAFLVAFTTLAVEITLTRMLSVITWYHLSFFAIAIGLLGATAGATTVYLRPNVYTPERRHITTVHASLGFTLSMTVAVLALSRFTVSTITSPTGALLMLLITVIAVIPFYFLGIVITVILNHYPNPIGRLYAADLAGASLGSVFVLLMLNAFDAPSLLLICAGLGALSAFVLDVDRRRTRLSLALFTVLFVLALVDGSALYGVRPTLSKGHPIPYDAVYLERWNTFSRILVFNPYIGSPLIWGPSPNTPRSEVEQVAINIDGDAATRINRFQSYSDLAHLPYDVTNVVYHLRPTGSAFIIGLGGGKDVQSALYFGHDQVVGIDVNPVFIDLLTDDFRQFAGIADYPGVTLIADEARSYLTRDPNRYQVIQMALIDTWAATGAGAFTLSENALYTKEAWALFLNHLAEDGIFTVSRWHAPDVIGETGRMMSLATATLLAEGIENPTDHLALITSERLSTLLMSRQPFSEADISTLNAVADDLNFTVTLAPGTRAESGILAEIVASQSLNDLHAVIADEPLNLRPTTDESPYFFNLLRFYELGKTVRGGVVTGVIGGSITALFTLVILLAVLLVTTLALVILPLVRRHQRIEQRIIPGAIYFALIGAGFMFVEIALIQRLTLFLGHPTYALGVLLFAIIASTGLGSYLSEMLPLMRAPYRYIYPLICVGAVIITRYTVSLALATLITAPLLTRIAVVVALILPLGLVMGVFFPTGMRLARQISADDTAWYWALNGVFGVLSSTLAVFVAMFAGISVNFWIGAICYLAVLIPIVWIGRLHAHPTLPPRTGDDLFAESEIGAK